MERGSDLALAAMAHWKSSGMYFPIRKASIEGRPRDRQTLLIVRHDAHAGDSLLDHG